MPSVAPGIPIAQNPFHVLGVLPTASRAEVEREAQRLLGMLEAGLGGAGTYSSPLGSHPRTTEVVREAMGRLRIPEKRLLDELWATPPSPDAHGGTPLQQVLRMHVACLGRKPGTLQGGEVTRLLAGWEAALAHRDTHRSLAERALHLGLASASPSSDALLASAREQVAEEVAVLVLHEKVPLADVEDVGEISHRAHRLVRDELLNRIQVASRALKQRVRDGREIPPDGERWEWVTLRHLYVETVQQGGAEVRHLAWDEFHASLMDLVVWLWNQRRLLSLSDEIEHWLLEEARVLHDARAVEQHEKNLRDSRPRGGVSPAMAPPTMPRSPLAPLGTQLRYASSGDPSAAALIITLLLLLFFVLVMTLLWYLGSRPAWTWTEALPRLLGLGGLWLWLRSRAGRH